MNYLYLVPLMAIAAVFFEHSTTRRSRRENMRRLTYRKTGERSSGWRSFFRR